MVSTRAWWRIAFGLLSLDAAFALLVALAAHPTPKPAEFHIALTPLPPAPAPASMPREVVVAIEHADRWPVLPPRPPASYEATVAIANPERRPPVTPPAPRETVVAITLPERRPPAPPAPYQVTLTIGKPAPRLLVDTSALTDGADRVAPSTVDRLVVVARAVLPERAPATASTHSDRLIANAPLLALRELPARASDTNDGMAPAPARLAVDDDAFAAQTATGGDRLIAASSVLAIAELPRRGITDDALQPSARVRVAAVDEIAATATAPAWSSEPPRPELLPTVRPSPAVLLAHWLPELSASATTAPLKTQFVQQLLPLVMQVNEGILQRRAHIAALAPRIEAGETLSESDTRFVADVLQDVRLEAWDTDEVLLRLDAVPLSMALAQAAQESGWGRSRSAREDNALFGQTMFLATGSRVQPFGDLLETVEAYARNLNSHRAYAEFRRSRAALRARGDVLDGHALVRFIERYSERGLSYVESIRQLMRMNNLFALDARGVDATLDAASSEPPAPTPASSAAVDSLLSDPAVPDAPVHGMDN